ncbi:MAG: ComF family protein [Lachnospiraceae bacterium]|nr:ComF family protein [Lachnospiraceae bacterium]
MILNSVFPPRCPVCGKLRIPWESSTCPECAGKLRFVKSPVCLCCGREISDETKEYCGRCEEQPMSFVRNFAVWQYDKCMKHSIADFKYNGRKEYAAFYIQHMKQCFGRQLRHSGVTALVPVPISAKRRRYRGFNQAELLADGLAKELGVSSIRLVKRVKNTKPQSGLSPKERKQNLTASLEWDEKEAKKLRELPVAVALVDDIFTTGATMEACTEVLQAHGILYVYGLCVCIGNE